MGSGGGGGGSTPSSRKGPKRGKGDEDGGGSSCELTFETDLSSIDVSELEKLQVGDELAVGLAQSYGFDSVVCRTTTDGALVGTVSHIENLSQLITCIRKGVRYSATITSLGQTFCSVMIDNR